MIELIKQLFVDAAILIAVLFIISHHFINKPLNHELSTKTKIMIGVISGLIGLILVVFGVQVEKNIIVDFRYIALMLSSIYSGPLASIIGGSIIAVFRLFYQGISYSSTVAALFVLSAATGCSIISKIKKGRKRKWLNMFIFCQINSFFVLYLLIADHSKFSITFFTYFVSFTFLVVLVYYYSESIALTNSYIRNLKKESTKDFLTGLNNVRSFDILYNAALKNARERSENLSVVIIDIDHFKKVNDTYGHQAGDAILKQLGDILKEGCREDDIVSRNGGEEFSIILINTPCGTAFTIAERIRKRVERHKFILPDSREINITISSGIATYPDSAEDYEALYKNADKALYIAKNSGRNKVCYYSKKIFNV
jgi:diguanylate cyclase